MNSVSFIHFSDTHIGDDESFQLYNRNTFNTSNRLVQHINTVDAPVDFVIHTGDIVNHPDTASVQLAKSLFSKLENPSFFINGNHDDPSIVDFLQTGKSETIENVGSSRFFVIKDYAFLILDTQGPQEIDTHGEFSEKHEEAIRIFLHRFRNHKIILFCHFPPLPIDAPWADSEMLIINGKQLHKQLLNSKTKVLGVFYGHIHHQTAQVRDGIFYVSAPSPFSQFSIYPNEQNVRIETDIPISFYYVTLLNNNIIVKTITVENSIVT